MSLCSEFKVNTPTPGKAGEEEKSESPSKVDTKSDNSKALFPTQPSQPSPTQSKVEDTKPSQEKPENIKPKAVFNPDEFSADELKEYSSRSQSVTIYSLQLTLPRSSTETLTQTTKKLPAKKPDPQLQSKSTKLIKLSKDSLSA